MARGYFEVAPFDSDRFAVKKRFGDFIAGGCQYAMESRPRNVHSFRTLPLFQTFQIFEPDGLHFFDRKADFFNISHRNADRFKIFHRREKINSPAFSRSRHKTSPFAVI
jgi:hypothetical protein